jgi:L-iditol 2-dehydrogenase
MKKMLAAQFNGKDYFELNRVPVPAYPEDGLLVKVTACAICGTDLKVMKKADVKLEGGKRRDMTLPRITGHELSGIVTQAGSRVESFSPGDPVVIAATIPCLRCASCRRTHYEMCDNIHIISYDSDGGFAEYIAVFGRVLQTGCVVKLEKAESLEKAAMAEPLSCALNCYALTHVKEGDVVVVMGGGPLGCFLQELARMYGAGTTVITDVSPAQLEKAGVAGADYYLDPSSENFKGEIKKITRENGADVVITACSSPEAQKLALEIVGKRGSVNFFGGLPRDKSTVALDSNLIHYKECTVSGTHGSTPGQVKNAVGIIESGKIDMEKYISHRFPLKEINQALDIARKGPRLKILIKPQE